MALEVLAGSLSRSAVNLALKATDRLIYASLQDCPKPLAAAVNKTVRPGKRLRPTLTIISASAGRTGIDHQVISAAAAVELIHKASLMHDAVTDQHIDGKRSGIFLLAGDYLLSRAMKLAQAADGPAAEAFADCIADMIGGEAEQAAGRRPIDPKNTAYQKIIADKTASLFSVACAEGGRLGGLNELKIKALNDYGHWFGMAFQIADDLIDGDFPADKISAAQAAARQYSVQAVRSLDNLNDRRATAALSKILQQYLATALPQTG